MCACGLFGEGRAAYVRHSELRRAEGARIGHSKNQTLRAGPPTRSATQWHSGFLRIHWIPVPGRISATSIGPPTPHSGGAYVSVSSTK